MCGKDVRKVRSEEQYVEGSLVDALVLPGTLYTRGGPGVVPRGSTEADQPAAAAVTGVCSSSALYHVAVSTGW